MVWPWQEIPVERIAAEIVERPMRLGAIEGSLLDEVRDNLARLHDLLPEFGNRLLGHAFRSCLARGPEIGKGFGTDPAQTRR